MTTKIDEDSNINPKENWVKKHLPTNVNNQQKWAQATFDNFIEDLANDPWLVDNFSSAVYPYGYRLREIRLNAMPTRMAGNLVLDMLLAAGFDSEIRRLPDSPLLAVYIKDPLYKELNGNYE